MINISFLKNSNGNSMEDKVKFLNTEEALKQLSASFLESIKNNVLEQLNDLTIGYLCKSKTNHRNYDYIANMVISKKAKTDEIYLYNLSIDKDMIVFFDRSFENVRGAIILEKLSEQYNNYTKTAQAFKHKLSCMYHLNATPNIFIVGKAGE